MAYTKANRYGAFGKQFWILAMVNMNILEGFGGFNKHLFKKIDLITKAQSLLYTGIWHNSDSLKLYEKCATKGGYSIFLYTLES